MGTVLVILSFFLKDNDLVCAPPPHIVVFPTTKHSLYVIMATAGGRKAWGSVPITEIRKISHIYLLCILGVVSK